jgi:hypothetical protein
MEPVRSSTVIVNNTTIINKTVINEAPATAAVEKVSGRKIQAVPVQELRHRDEAAVVAQQRTLAATSDKKNQTPVPSEAPPAETKAVAAHEPPQIQNSAPVTAESRAADKSETRPEVKPAPKPEGNHPPAITEPTGQNANKQPVKQEKSAQPPNPKVQQVPKQPATEKPAAGGNNGANPADKGQDKNSNDQQ